jgi:hypothetical protein
MQVKDLKPAGYNPRKITKAQLERLKKSKPFWTVERK